MSIACKCERCGKLYEPIKSDEVPTPNQASPRNTFNAITLNHKDYNNDSCTHVGFTRMDICPACAHSFAKWWAGSDTMSNRGDE